MVGLEKDIASKTVNVQQAMEPLKKVGLFFSTLVYLSKTICILTIVISPAIITRKSSCQLELLISLIFFKHRSLNTFDKKNTY